MVTHSFRMPSSRPHAPDSPPASSFQEHVIRQTFPAAHPWLAVVILVAIVAFAYRGVWHLGFIWDDDIYLTGNPCLIGPLHFADIWTSMHARICPLVISCFWLQFQFWGLNALPYHLVNVAFHATTAVLLWRTLQVLGVRGAWLGAALWAIHPVQVESVAWISELKNAQSGLFFVLCVYFYAKWEKGGATSRGRYLLAVLFALLAMASKSSTVVLPPILLLCSWWITGRLPFKRWLAIIPFGLLALATVALSMWSQNLEGANEAEWARSGPERLITAGRVMAFYLGNLAWPQPLMFIYPRWNVNAANVIEWLAPLGCVVVAVALL
ncbi:MAG: Tetratricopeptide 2 repeat protein, partial [Verrucomicrobiaceae bacterium]|nr:Tetratricopeptide 2 repeat protein [Verrucomicrobiaceae bacterium]